MDFDYAFPSVSAEALFKQKPEDFLVEEILGFEPDGEGEHQCLWVEKRNLTTDDAVRHLSRCSGISRRDISYAGIKDRIGVTRQWFSLRTGLGRPLDPAIFQTAELAVIRCVRNRRKIRRGSHRGNRFRITLCQCPVTAGELSERLQDIQRLGVPNYFGPQRFGRNGANVARVQDCFRKGLLPKERFLRGMLLSSARAWLFNHYLQQRIRAGTWNRYLPGDYCILDGTDRGFVPDPQDTELESRMQALDIHPAGPLWGKGSAGKIPRPEFGPEADFAGLSQGLERSGLEHGWRALRIRVRDLVISDMGEDRLMIEFALGRGAYATTVLRELITVNQPDIFSA